MGSSPVPGTSDVRRTKATSSVQPPYSQARNAPSTSGHSIPSTRMEANDPGPERRQRATAGATEANSDASRATEALPPELTEIVDAWKELPEAIKAAILAMVRASRKRGAAE
jgi:hypothetical protein